MTNLSYDEIIAMIEEKAKNIEATITRNDEGVAVMSKSDDYEPCV